MSRFNFTESFKQTIAEFEALPEGNKADYFRSQRKDRPMPSCSTPSRQEMPHCKNTESAHYDAEIIATIITVSSFLVLALLVAAILFKLIFALAKKGPDQ